ncbi:hypothetical protein BJV77DRAFT_1046918 [Russula vinacea]|nr:hypothetical protein BJV77DRAFT_1046918 [Russula vinacea]
MKQAPLLSRNPHSLHRLMAFPLLTLPTLLRSRIPFPYSAASHRKAHPTILRRSARDPLNLTVPGTRTLQMQYYNRSFIAHFSGSYSGIWVNVKGERVVTTRHRW